MSSSSHSHTRADLPTTIPPGIRDGSDNNFVFHVYVDPMYGDDYVANLYNPRTNPTGPQHGRPLQTHPLPASQGGYLQQAPYSFRTLTGTQGAIQYTSQFLGGPLGNIVDWTNPSTQKRVWWIVIHCLPGLYGPGTTIDPTSGLRWNNETFPVLLADGVSLQGTSALDTILDAKGGAQPIITQTSSFLPSRTFVDSLTIRGAKSNNGGLTDPSGAGIFIPGQSYDAAGWASYMVVSNCFFVENTIGIAIDHLDDHHGQPLPHILRIVNNTFAWNGVGIWNGLRNGQIATNHGAGATLVHNNVFDTRTPKVAPPVTPVAAFQGISCEELTVRSYGGLTLCTSFNAWEPAMANAPTTAAANWPTPSLRPPTGVCSATCAPRVDLTPFVRPAGGGPRGVLFVRDRLASIGVSPHDFRLAPLAFNAQTGAYVLNPLVDVGLDGGDLANTFHTIQFDNQAIAGGPTSIGTPPGLLPPGPGGPEDVARLDAWDWDADGYGNPRIHDRTGFPNQTVYLFGGPPVTSYIDLGADELDELTISGYIDNTRMFGYNVPNASVPTRGSLYFFNLPGTYPRPVYTELTGGRLYNMSTGAEIVQYPWWPHVQGNPNPPVDYGQCTLPPGFPPCWLPGTNMTAGAVSLGNFPPWSDRGIEVSLGLPVPPAVNCPCTSDHPVFMPTFRRIAGHTQLAFLQLICRSGHQRREGT